MIKNFLPWIDRWWIIINPGFWYSLELKWCRSCKSEVNKEWEMLKHLTKEEMT